MGSDGSGAGLRKDSFGVVEGFVRGGGSVRSGRQKDCSCGVEGFVWGYGVGVGAGRAGFSCCGVCAGLYACGLWLVNLFCQKKLLLFVGVDDNRGNFGRQRGQQRTTVGWKARGVGRTRDNGLG